MYLALDGQDENRLHFKVLTSFFSYFEKIAHMSVVWAYVSLWLCVFGFLLQEPIRLKIL